FKFRLAETEIAKVAPDGLGKFRCSLCPKLSQCFARAIHLRTDILDFFSEPFQLGIAPFNFLHPFGRALAEGDHIRDRAAIFALQSFEERNALLERGELLRIEIEFFSISGERARNLGKLDHACSMPR